MSAHNEGKSPSRWAWVQPGCIKLSLPRKQIKWRRPFSVLRELGWPTPEDPSAHDDEQLADRLSDEANVLVTCAKWLEEIATGQSPIVNLRPTEDWPDCNHTTVDYARLI